MEGPADRSLLWVAGRQVKDSGLCNPDREERVRPTRKARGMVIKEETSKYPQVIGTSTQ